jgi:putative transposase
VVWVTKYRRKVLKPDVQAYLRKVLPTLLESLPGAKLESIGFENDHVHMVLTIPPRYAVSSVMRYLKSQSTKKLRSKFAFLKKAYWKENVVWSVGYFVDSVGVDEATIKKYVEYQGSQDSGRAKLF